MTNKRLPVQGQQIETIEKGVTSFDVFIVNLENVLHLLLVILLLTLNR